MVKALERHVQYSMTHSVAGVQTSAQARLPTEELFQIIHMHTMNREIIPGRKKAGSTVSSINSDRQLRSSGSSNYTVPRTKFGDRAFSVAEPVIWNSIPESIRALDNDQTFKRLLKMHFLKLTSLILSFHFNSVMLHYIPYWSGSCTLGIN